jgi:hypothetical protein
MSYSILDNLLIQISKGDTSDDVLARAQDLLALEERLPEALRVESLRDDPVATSVALLGLLGHDDGFGLELAHALAFELEEGMDRMSGSGGLLEVPNLDPNHYSGEITQEMVEAVEQDGIPVAPSVRFEAGHCDIAIEVMHTLGLSHNQPISAAIASLAGPIDVASNVMSTLGLEQKFHIEDAIEAEAGTVDVVEAVMAQVRRDSVVPGYAPVEQKPSNTRWMHWSALAVAAAMLVSIVSLPILRGSSNSEGLVSAGLQFASAAEIVVDDLSYDEEVFVQVIQDTDDEGGQALIIWIDDEAVL